MIKVLASELPLSKSLMNRALIIKSFFPEIEICSAGALFGADVLNLKASLDSLKSRKFFIGEGAAPLRFLALRLSRFNGKFEILGSERLFSRPITELVDLLTQLGCTQVQVTNKSLAFHSPGVWPSKVALPVNQTSQLLSGILLSSWELPQSLEVELLGTEFRASETYFSMTIEFLSQLGWRADLEDEKIIVPPKQNIVPEEINVEPDMSAAATVAVLGAVSKGVFIEGLPLRSLQGDFKIFKLLEEAGIEVKFTTSKQSCSVNVQGGNIQKLTANLVATPDLFPVLAAMVVNAKDKSLFTGLDNLNSKESPRLDRMFELLQDLGVLCDKTKSSLSIKPIHSWKQAVVYFSADQDHRLAMAAGVLQAMGAPLAVKDPDVVEKSFPNFWEIQRRFTVNGG